MTGDGGIANIVCMRHGNTTYGTAHFLDNDMILFRLIVLLAYTYAIVDFLTLPHVVVRCMVAHTTLSVVFTTTLFACVFAIPSLFYIPLIHVGVFLLAGTRCCAHALT